MAENGRTCPECGYAFDLFELRREVRPGDWTLGRGLRKAAGVLAIRGLVCMLVWVLVVLVVDLLYVLLVPGQGMIGLAIMISLCVAFAIGGGVVGDRIGRQLDEIAGFQSTMLVAAAVLTCWVALAGGTLLVDLMRPINVAPAGIIAFIAGSVATVWIIRCALVSEA